jgi:hypothetical protein
VPRTPLLRSFRRWLWALFRPATEKLNLHDGHVLALTHAYQHAVWMPLGVREAETQPTFQHISRGNEKLVAEAKEQVSATAGSGSHVTDPYQNTFSY